MNPVFMFWLSVTLAMVWAGVDVLVLCLGGRSWQATAFVAFFVFMAWVHARRAPPKP